MFRAVNFMLRKPAKIQALFPVQQRRFLLLQSSTATSQQAFLENLESTPGVTCLSLNRPQSRNAISTTLLQVGPYITTRSWFVTITYVNVHS